MRRWTGSESDIEPDPGGGARATQARAWLPSDRPSVSTVNGFGTGLRGWNHQDDGTAFATSWVLFSYLPILPLRRYHVRVLTDFQNEPFVPAPADGGRFSLGISWREPIEVLGRLPLSWREIGLTVLRAYVLVPLLCAWPLLVGVPILGLVSAGRRAPTSWVNAIVLVSIANVLVVLLAAARRMRGYSRPERVAGLHAER